MDPQSMLPWLIQEGTRWVQSQRDAHRPGARPLDDREVDALERFFGPTIMNLASIKAVSHIGNPPFYPMLVQTGIPVIDFAQGGGITFIDTILISKEHTPPGPIPLSLVFHELVHVVQYDVAGVDEFVSRYVKGWFAQGLRYASIPIEHQAYELQARYEANPSIGFSVVAYVQRAGVP
jgi:hypothetical protein